MQVARANEEPIRAVVRDQTLDSIIAALRAEPQRPIRQRVAAGIVPARELVKRDAVNRLVGVETPPPLHPMCRSAHVRGIGTWRPFRGILTEHRAGHRWTTATNLVQ